MIGEAGFEAELHGYLAEQICGRVGRTRASLSAAAAAIQQVRVPW